MNIRYIKKVGVWGLSAVLAVSTLTLPTGATIQDEKDALWNLQKEKQEVNDLISSLESEKSTLEENVRILDTKLSEISEKLYETENKLAKVKKKIKKNKKKLKAANKSIKEQYAAMKLRIQFMYENGNQQMMDLFFSSENIADFLNKAEYITELSTYDRDMLDKMKETRQTIIDTEAKLEKQEDELTVLKTEQTQEKEDIESLVAAKQQEIGRYVDEIADKEELVDELEAQIGSKQHEIYEMESIEAQRAIEQESREQESREQESRENASRAAEQADNGNSNTQTPEPTTTQASYQPSGGYIWPLSGTARYRSRSSAGSPWCPAYIQRPEAPLPWCWTARTWILPCR